MDETFPSITSSDMFYQDNRSTILLSENGRTSLNKEQGTLDFFVTDKIIKGEMKAMYCLTENMLADFSPSHYREWNLENA